jgi:hypothetical protein
MSTNALRAAITGLIGLAATEEEVLLASAPDEEQGSPQCWPALPLVAHNTEFRQQQVIRLHAVVRGETPPAFAEIDHRSAETYGRYSAVAATEVISLARQSASDLIDGLGAVSGADLSDASRHPWLRGRQLWLQVVVRGFWHPTGHLGDYHITHGQPARAIALHQHALATARYLEVPDMAIGMAAYSLACAQAQAGATDEALQTLTVAIALNQDLRAHARKDPDLARLRDRGRLDVLTAPTP